MGANFITGTGTDIGKTWLCCALLRHWREQRRHPEALKPVLSGFDPAAPGASDAGALLEALGQAADERALEAIAPWRYAAPLSPDLASAREGRQVPFDALVGFTRRAAERAEGPLLVEGVGGVMVPLDENHTVRDWIAAAGLPCVLVAGSYLGSISHTLSALESLRHGGVPVTAIAVNESEGSSVALGQTLASLTNHVGGIPLLGIRRDDPGPGIARLAGLLA